MNKIGINRRRWVDRQKATRYSSPIISDENNGRVFNTKGETIIFIILLEKILLGILALEVLKWTLSKMAEACNKPVIDYNTGEEAE
jgi:hypothetical protein